MSKTVFVSGCFDMLHSGHVAFLEEAASYGDLHVALGSDSTVYQLKGRLPVNTEQERLYMMQSLTCVKSAFISSGSGILDFATELRVLKPDRFIVNEDGSTPQKEALCRAEGIEYLILKRQPHGGLIARSTTNLRQIDQMPYRIDIAGGWLDQPFVSRLHPGPVLTISLEPSVAFNERSGMATSTRNKALELWGFKLPAGDPVKMAKILFCYDNPPGTTEISGSQDSIGIVMPGLTRANYTGEYWPSTLENIGNEPILQFIEQSLYLLPLGPREDGYNPLASRNVTAEWAASLATAADQCWQAILNCDIQAFGQAFNASFEAQIAMFPYMVNDTIHDMIDTHRDMALGWKLSGAGGGGYLIFVAEKPIPNAIQVQIRRGIE
jgi:cytidyltransferase-like protein